MRPAAASALPGACNRPSFFSPQRAGSTAGLDEHAQSRNHGVLAKWGNRFSAIQTANLDSQIKLFSHVWFS